MWLCFTYFMYFFMIIVPRIIFEQWSYKTLKKFFKNKVAVRDISSKLIKLAKVSFLIFCYLYIYIYSTSWYGFYFVNPLLHGFLWQVKRVYMAVILFVLVCNNVNKMNNLRKLSILFINMMFTFRKYILIFNNFLIH